MIMSDEYRTAVERAAAALAGSILDSSRGVSGDALVAALRAFVGDEGATAFPPAAVERVQRDIIVYFGDTFSARVRRDIDVDQTVAPNRPGRCSPTVESSNGLDKGSAEVVDWLIMEGIAEALRTITK
jgi:hypothetical protein